jgi:hypothetical protein
LPDLPRHYAAEAATAVYGDSPASALRQETFGQSLVVSVARKRQRIIRWQFTGEILRRAIGVFGVVDERHVFELIALALSRVKQSA